MGRLDLLSQPRVDRGRKYRRPAVLASLVCHGFGLAAVLALALLYRDHLPLTSNGSAAGATSISLEEMVVSAAVSPAPAVPAASAAHPLGGVPVLLAQPFLPFQDRVAKTRTEVHRNSAPVVQATSRGQGKLAAATSVSSFAPGVSVLTHPPYPIEARDRGEMGTVVMSVQFDTRGEVAAAEVEQSSGVPVLDSETRSFVRANWHSTEYAGQAISVPVEYTFLKSTHG